eukprot:247869_1
MANTPHICWAERKDILLVTITIQDAQDTKFDLSENSIGFEGVSSGGKYELKIELLHEITVDESTYRVLPRQIEMKLKKKEEGPYWGKLQKGKKTSMIEIDWAKWKDEDEEAEKDFGGFGQGMDFGDMGGMGGLG